MAQTGLGHRTWDSTEGRRNITIHIHSAHEMHFEMPVVSFELSENAAQTDCGFEHIKILNSDSCL